jgi:hypothetical protein
MHETAKAIPHGVAFFILREKMLAFRRRLPHRLNGNLFGTSRRAVHVHRDPDFP